nr:hypothetical protein [Tanacetum cinerariifolium]
NKKPKYLKSEEKKEDKKADEKIRDTSKGKCYNCKKEGHFAKDCKKAKKKPLPRAGENKIEFAYDYGNLNGSYVNKKIKFSDDYFQEIINLDFEKINSPFQQTSSLKPYVPTMILEKIIIDLEDEVDQAWMESNSDLDQEINANMVFIAKMEKVLSDSKESSSSAEETIAEVSYYTSDSESESEYETSE